MTTPTKLIDGVAVPMTPEEAAAWLAEQEAITSRPDPVPYSITPLQARRALRAAGLKAQVDAYIAALSAEDQEAWEFAITIHRDNAIIAGGAQLLGLTASQVDDLFRLGATL